MIDPAGLALENFDAVGAWRTRDGGTRGTPVDASGQLVDGTEINGVVELRQALLREPEMFVATLTEKLLTYALGPRPDGRRHAGGARDRARRPDATTTGSRRSCWASSAACRSRCASKAPAVREDAGGGDRRYTSERVNR